MNSPHTTPPFYDTSKAEAEHIRKQAGPGSIMYDIQWVLWAVSFPVRALVSWRRKQREKGNPWAPSNRPDSR
jgi:hypothetical protein